ncbi:ACP phosphodiesterase [Aquimarina sp. ERC-38]|uniref:acyl carrier protein phosphodiesterase n=1 Tax=Aquimarina sp. ERC-38 TaxID=2949996 RepID=UPI002246E41E|nr:ACP phosphodiesterase [Aquimarina sp. ERC-38]UZO79860.1 ACP phosphodiesterase [Aquimarina sp. ERC-38]
MNFLAHIYLSAEDPELKIGNFIADSVKGKKFEKFPLRIAQGIHLHRKIDHYTDHHPIVKQSISRLKPTYKRYSGVIVDLFYDHFLAYNWDSYADLPLETYSVEFYKLLQEYQEVLPKRVQNFMPYMIKNNWLLQYASIPGISSILYQMNQRTKNVSKMNFAIIELEQHYSLFQKEFELFFKELQQFTHDQIQSLS